MPELPAASIAVLAASQLQVDRARRHQFFWVESIPKRRRRDSSLFRPKLSRMFTGRTSRQAFLTSYRASWPVLAQHFIAGTRHASSRVTSFEIVLF
jgi:hypothetical protein